MSKKSTQESKGSAEVRGSSKSSGPDIHTIKSTELEHAAGLIARLKRLNGEFDPLLKTSDNVEDQALKTIKSAVSNKDSVVLVAAIGEKIVGVVKADLIDRVFYEPRREGSIVEFYILPEYRRGSLGNDLLDAIASELKKRGAVLITAEFPSQNEIAKKFYSKLGFRSLTNVYAK
ncbi:MAG: GNAT family N-acetyltransferase [Thaumarchaeota archaeon]|nr:GNAT family N-acetyltransferase [Nitrososphaerota archaeon]